jgi:uncharacterized protein (DUF58 family)
MLVAAINYQNNMSFALTFLLANLFVVAVLHSYANLSGLTITAVEAEDGFPGQRTAFHLRLSSGRRRGHMALEIGWPVPAEERRRRRFLVGLFSSPEMLAATELDLAPGTQRELRLYLQVGGRGWYRPGRLRIESVYPLGLLRCWTWIDMDLAALVYPRPARAEAAPVGGSGAGEGHQIGGSGDDEFFGLRDYRHGDSPRRVFWKGLARGQELQSKDFAAALADDRWLDWDDYPALGTEQRLSALCERVLDCHRREIPFGLRIPGTELAAAQGEGQKLAALRALALYAQGDVTRMEPA